MRNRILIINTLVDYLKTSDLIEHVTKFRFYQQSQSKTPVINITHGEDVPNDRQILAGYVWRTLDVIFEVIAVHDDAMEIASDYDQEIERLLTVEDNPLDQLEDSTGQNIDVKYSPVSLEEPDPPENKDTDREFVKIRLHYPFTYFEKLGGTS